MKNATIFVYKKLNEKRTFSHTQISIQLCQYHINTACFNKIIRTPSMKYILLRNISG